MSGSERDGVDFRVHLEQMRALPDHWMAKRWPVARLELMDAVGIRRFMALYRRAGEIDARANPWRWRTEGGAILAQIDRVVLLEVARSVRERVEAQEARDVTPADAQAVLEIVPGRRPRPRSRRVSDFPRHYQEAVDALLARGEAVSWGTVTDELNARLVLDPPVARSTLQGWVDADGLPRPNTFG